MLLGERRPQLTVTDPPYGIELDSEWRDRAGFYLTRRVHADGTIGPGHRRSVKPVIDILAPMRQGASFNAKVIAGEASQR
jgi:hypothetical protein